MKVYLAGTGMCIRMMNKLTADEKVGMKVSDVNWLVTYYDILKNTSEEKVRPYTKQVKSLLMDSGAFSFVRGQSAKVNWNEYIERYADFINRNDIQLFFELDIDKIVGLQEVERLRSKLERLTNKKPIPVWHHWRGKQSMEELSKNYPYVAYGAFITDGLPQKISLGLAPWAINVAHKNGAKIHGLGFTPTNTLSKYNFDSVDSTSWLYGNKWGYIDKFNIEKGTMEKYMRKKGTKLNTEQGGYNNFLEWLKYSKYMENHIN